MSAERAATRPGRTSTGPASPSPTRSSSPTASRRRFGGLTAVDVDHVEIQRNQITALIGPNGAGKTTFFNLLTGFDEPDGGTWHFDGVEPRRQAPHKVARLGMVRTFQLTKSLARMSVIENMRLGATGQRRRAGVGGVAAVLVAQPGGRRSRPRPTACSSASASTTCATSSPATSPAASASCWRWPGR